MAPPRTTVATISSPYNSINPPSSASVVPNRTAALRSQPAPQHTQGTLHQVENPVPPTGSPDAPHPARQTLGLTNNPHVQDGASYVPRPSNVESAIESVQGMKTFACGLFGVWPLEKLARLFGGKREKNAESTLQAVDMMGDMAPPPYRPPK